MKKISLYTLVTTSIILSHGAIASGLTPQYINAVATHNISVIQHSIMTTSFNSLDPSPKGALTAHDKPDATTTEHNRNLYGTMRMYGEDLNYGEYGDDGTVFSSSGRGRNGGDASSEAFHSIWLDWKHFDEHTKFDSMNRIDSKYDLISLGIMGDTMYINNGVANWGIFGGYIHANEDPKSLGLSEIGGHIGIGGGYHVHGLGISFAANGGIMKTKSDALATNNHFSNSWFGIATNITYNISLDDTFVIQPGIYSGYTWIKSDNYMSGGINLTNNDLNSLDVSPTLRAIKHIANEWYGIATARYVFGFYNGGEIYINNTQLLPELDLGNYSEYGITIEKHTNQIQIAFSINRHDGARTGWNGGVQLRYAF